ncbi:MAG: thioredoxin family protein [Gemmatimonadaceae bacterium]|nr:thioredoxin family protein [Gemmatimonadaceae bacterium]
MPVVTLPDRPTRHCTARRGDGSLRRTLRAAAFAGSALAVAAGRTGAQGTAVRDPSPHSDVVLVAESATVVPGQRLTVAVRLTLDPGWHTYWINPGDAGLPLTVQWTLPPGVTAGPLQFPTPRLAPQPPLMSYGYEREVLVLSELQVSDAVAPGTTLQLAGTARWLACAEVCLPASGPLALAVATSSAASTASTPHTAAIAATRAQVPRTSERWQSSAWRTATGYTVMFIPDSAAAAALSAPFLFVDSAGVVEHPAPERVARAGDTLVIALTRAAGATGAVAALHGVVTADRDARTPTSWAFRTAVQDPSAQRRARAAALLDAAGRDVGGLGAPGAIAVATGTAEGGATDAAPGADMSLAAAILFAFIGGLLLNLMPCVFPVLTVKVLALLEHGGTAQVSRARRHGLVFGAGVLLSFWILAGLLMALRAGGEQLGWGFQLQSPPVVGLLALLMFALALNLSGVFEIGLSLTRLGGMGAGRSYADSLLTGGLAVLVAAPCTAPFMGAALGYALVQPALLGLLVFTALGLGLALPFVVLASVPSLLRFLPRPGPWLETLKQLFAFPLYATAVWLLWVFGQQAGIDALALVLLAMIVLALGAWLWARGVRADRAPVRMVAAAVMLAAIALTAIGGTRMTRPAVAAGSTPVAGWEPWSAERVAALRAEGRPVFIDFTAAWCLSCQVNERVALRTDAVERAFRDANVALLRADWTSRDSAITEVLAGFGRSGVPLYVLYPAGGGAATLLPAVLSPGMVVTAVRKAAPGAAFAARPR